KWNSATLVKQDAGLRVPVETALRLPAAITGALTAILIYLVAAELFGVEIALIAAALWAFDPSAIGFNRIAKEDTFFLFFFLLANVFWLRGQRVAEGQPARNPEPYYWATAAAFGAMLASKYMPQFLAISISYNYIFQLIPETRWRIGKRRFLIFFAIVGAAFLLFNPTILLPATWREMMSFASYKRIGHDSYEFMGQLYTHKMQDWVKGIPWYFYFVFMGVKLPLATLAAFIIGLPLAFRRKLGDGRYFLLFWLFFWTMTFTFTGGKFTRYFTTALPAVLLTAAIGIRFIARALALKLAALFSNEGIKIYARAALVLLFILSSISADLSAAPYYRLYTNLLGGGREQAGALFPQDDFYDAYMREVMSEIASRAGAGAHVASETPGLAAYYAGRANRSDLVCVSLSDPQALREFTTGDFIIAARGRRYYSNAALLDSLRQTSAPAFRASVGNAHAVDIYLVDQTFLSNVRQLEH
ncbi:MAG: glycosyltransferase family 39 protein, partial [Pyrinomonadaceae bacterium]